MTFFRYALLLFLTWVAAASVGAAQPMDTFNFQGRLTQADGTVVTDGAYTVDFALYTVATDGAPLWQETQVVNTQDGLFTVQLGSSTPLGTLTFDQPYYLSLTVNGQAMMPRTLLSATPYAMRAQRLAPSALQAGANVTISENGDGTLRISSTGGSGGNGGLTSITSDATLEGDGTTGSPLGLAANAILSGTNISVSRDGAGRFTINSTGNGGGGLSAVASDATLSGNGTASTPLGVADGAISGLKIADGALVPGSNVTITRQAGGALEIAATGGGSGGLTTVASNATLFGDGTAGNPLSVSVPLALSGTAPSTIGIVSGTHSSGNLGQLGTDAEGVIGQHNAGHVGTLGSATFGASGEHSNGNAGILGHAVVGVIGQHNSGNFGQLGTSGEGVIGIYLGSSNSGRLGTSNEGVRGQNGNGNFGLLGSGNEGAAGIHNNGNLGILGASTDGVFGRHNNSNVGGLGGTNSGAYGQSASGNLGRLGTSNEGVYGENAASGYNGLLGYANYGAYGGNPSSTNEGYLGTEFYGGFFRGDVHVTGTLSKAGGSFKIDHPLDPANKYLSHSFVESPDMMNVYNGNVTTDVNGTAVVTLPDYFEALNRDFRYQLTVIGDPGSGSGQRFAQAIVAEKVQNNRFVIRTDQPGVEVSWQVTGIRQDAWAKTNPIPVEEMKPLEARGYYLHPEAFGLSLERRHDIVKRPDVQKLTLDQ